ncbi:hypothetical protein PENSPDRAFT_666257 [Peniophora sp. CONT]|nr:hypothetical protein PENSPDRAFT_666257 [Peniophora sp. CONT]
MGLCLRFSLLLSPTMAHVQLSDRNPVLNYIRAVTVVLETQNERQVDLRVLAQLLQLFQDLPEGQVLFPRAVDYPSLEGLQQQITLAVDSMGTRTLAWQSLGRLLPVVVTLYDLYAMRIDAIATQNSTESVLGVHHPPADVALFVPRSELLEARTRVELLRPLDDIIDHQYAALKRGALDGRALAHVTNFAYQIVSHHGPEQSHVVIFFLFPFNLTRSASISGQSASAYVSGLSRKASPKYLAFVYLSTQLAAVPDEISPAQVLGLAEKMAEPLSGAGEQGDFLRRLFPAKVFDGAKYNGLPSLTKEALRSPYEVWPSLQGCCLSCGSKEARYTCSLCGKIKYCRADCQRSTIMPLIGLKSPQLTTRGVLRIRERASVARARTWEPAGMRRRLLLPSVTAMYTPPPSDDPDWIPPPNWYKMPATCFVCRKLEENRWGEPEDPLKMITCAKCGHHAHPKCWDVEEAAEQARQYDWCCARCYVCRACGTDKDVGSLIDLNAGAPSADFARAVPSHVEMQAL